MVKAVWENVCGTAKYENKPQQNCTIVWQCTVSSGLQINYQFKRNTRRFKVNRKITEKFIKVFERLEVKYSQVAQTIWVQLCERKTGNVAEKEQH